MPTTREIVAALVSKLKQCRDKRDLKGGRLAHHQAIQARCHRSKYVVTALISMYSKCGTMKDALDAFNTLKTKGAVSWTSLIVGYAENGNNMEALEAFDNMDCAPDSVTFVVALKACSNLASWKTTEKETCLAKGMEIHRKAVKFGVEKDQTVSNALIHMYSKCGGFVYARNVFDSLHNRTVVSWTSLILGYVDIGEFSEALNVYSSMDCPPDSVTFVAALKACTGLASENVLSEEQLLETIQSLCKQAKRHGCESEIVVRNSLINLYSKCGWMKLARDTFEEMTTKDVVSWSSLILGYVENGQSLKALESFSCMDCAPDRVTFLAAVKACTKLASEHNNKTVCLNKLNELQTEMRKFGFDKDPSFASAMVGVYSKCNDMRTARKLFETIDSRDSVVWNALLLGYLENGDSFTALKLFNRLDCEPDKLTFVAALRACANLVDLTSGRKIHDHVCRLGFEEDVEIGSCLIDLYGMCGNTFAAQLMFNQMHSHDKFSWSSLIRGYGLLGESSQVFQLVNKMQSENPETHMDHVLLQLILSACSHSGRLDHGQRWLERSRIEPDVENYACMVAMLGRAHTVQEALSVMKAMPLKANSLLWITLLAACSKWNDVQTGKVAFDAVVAENDKECTSAAYVHMRNIPTLQT